MVKSKPSDPAAVLRRAAAKAKRDRLENELALQLKQRGVFALFERELEFHPDRKWRFDFACRDLKLAVEVEGGTWSGGRHIRGAGFREDCIKYAEAALLGWMVLRGDSSMVKDGSLADYVKAAIYGQDRKNAP